MSSFYNLQMDVNRLVDELLEEDAKRVSATEVGLDERAGYVYVANDFIAIRNTNRSSLDYYGGFEYVDKDCITGMGWYTFYSSDDERVQDAIDVFEGRERYEDDEDDE